MPALLAACAAFVFEVQHCLRAVDRGGDAEAVQHGLELQEGAAADEHAWPKADLVQEVVDVMALVDVLRLGHANFSNKRRPSWLRTCGPFSSKASRRRTAYTSVMRAVISSGVSHSTAVDSVEVRSSPPDGLQRKTRATMPRVVFL